MFCNTRFFNWNPWQLEINIPDEYDSTNKDSILTLLLPIPVIVLDVFSKLSSPVKYGVILIGAAETPENLVANGSP